MSAHAETSHSHEGHDSESAVETFFEGINKIFKSVRLAVTNVYKGVKGILSNLVSPLRGGNTAHASHNAPASPDAHAKETHGEAGHDEKKKEEHH